RTPRARPRRASRRRRARRPGGARASSGELLLELGVRVGRLLAQQVDLVGEALEVRRVVRVAVVEVADELGLRRRALAERGGDLARRLGDTALVVEVLLRRLVLVAELGLLVGELADAVLRRGELRARGLELRVGAVELGAQPCDVLAEAAGLALPVRARLLPARGRQPEVRAHAQRGREREGEHDDRDDGAATAAGSRSDRRMLGGRATGPDAGRAAGAGRRPFGRDATGDAGTGRDGGRRGRALRAVGSRCRRAGGRGERRRAAGGRGRRTGRRGRGRSVRRRDRRRAQLTAPVYFSPGPSPGASG